ncbi:cell wall-binding repeat-containing protein [Kineococcus sp. SYSU DK002]|uniref:cell wall-binding repeat-containing protein n=1 Tax=Kineococcus sp. SYSU DK002 TaxID=3383123 RepID=UPI003D7D7B56
MNKRVRTRRRIAGVGAGVALLVGLGGVVGAPAQAATGFNPGAADARLGGADRYATAAIIAQKYWTSARTVIVANGETNGIDALSASYLAGVKNAPILLTTATGVPAATAEAIRTLNPSEVIVIGGEPSVSAQAFSELTNGRATSKRIAGTDRFDTAAKIIAEARAGLPANAPAPSVLLARGDVYGSTIAADALAASPLGYRGVPIVLTAQNFLPNTSATVLGDLDPASVTALGSVQSVSAAVAGQAAAAAGVPSTARLEGADRSGTAAAIAGSPLATAVGIGKTAVGLANGFRVDALAAGPAAGKAGYPLLLTESASSLGSATEAYLRANAGNLISAQVFGDATAVSLAVTEAAKVTGGGLPPAQSATNAVLNPVAQAPANLDNQSDLPDVRVTFDLENVNPAQLSVQRIASNNLLNLTSVDITGQDLSTGSFIDYDVPAGSWIYRITTTNGQQTAAATTQSPAVSVAAPALSGQPTGLTVGSTSVRINFDQPVSGLVANEVTSNSLTVTFGTPIPVTPVSGRSAAWDVPITSGALAAGNTVTVVAGSVANATGSTGPAAGFTSLPIAPTPVVVGQPSGLRVGSSSIQVTFNQPVGGLGVSDVTSSNNALAFTPTPNSPDANGLSATWTIGITGGPLAPGDTITVSGGAVSNLQGTTSNAFTSTAVAAVPAVSNRTGMTVGSTTVRFTFTQAVSGLAAGDLSSNDSNLVFAPVAVSPDPNGRSAAWDVNITGGPLSANDTVVLAAGSVENEQGTTGPAAQSSEAVVVPLTVSATINSTPASNNLTAIGDTIVLQYSAPLDTTTLGGVLAGLTAGGPNITGVSVFDALTDAIDTNSYSGSGGTGDVSLSGDATTLTITVTAPGSADNTAMTSISPDNRLRGTAGEAPSSTGSTFTGYF